MADLEIQLFGTFQVMLGQPITTLHSPRQQALLAWLLLHAGNAQPRRHIAFAMWPDSDEPQAQTNLRRELYHLRRGLPRSEEFLEVNAQILHWRTDAPYALDVSEFKTAGHSLLGSVADLEHAAGLYQGDLLPALDDEWLEPYRTALHDQAVLVNGELIRRHVQAGNQPLALRVAQRLLTLEPLRESVYAQIMQLQFDMGDRAAAVHTYGCCVDALRAELGASPGSTVRGVYENIQRGQDDRPPTPGDALPLIGREHEWPQILTAWRVASAGASKALLIVGEAGIGKTRLAEALLQLAGAQHARSARTRSYAAEGRLAYAPVSEWLRRPALQSQLVGLEDLWKAELARLLPELAPESPVGGILPSQLKPLSEGWQRQRLFEALARAFLNGSGPLLLLLDDIQWCDRDTLEWLHFLLRFEPRAPVLLLCTLRREDQDTSPALSDFMRDLQQSGLLDRVDLGPLSFEECGALAASVLQQELSVPAQIQLFEATEGQPLYIVEAVRAGLVSGAVSTEASPRVQAIIAARLSQLSPVARSVTGLAATIGRAFDPELLRQASDLEEQDLVAALDELWQRAVIREQAQGGGTYDFTHDRLREGAYAELSPARRRLLHRRVAQALELQHLADPGVVAAQLAAQYEGAGQTGRAVQFSLLAAERANHVSASRDAIVQATRALHLLEGLPASRERDLSELVAHNSLAASFTAMKGFTPPELEFTLNRALELGRSLGDNSAVIRSLWGLFALHVVRGNVGLARRQADQAMNLTGEDTGLLTDVHQALGGVDLTEGRLAAAAEHFAVTNRLYSQHRHRRVLFGSDVGVFSLAWGAHGQWLQGHVEEARRQVMQAEAIATELGHPFTQMQAAAYRCISHQLEGNLDASWANAEETIAGCKRYNIAYYHEWGVIVGGWVMGQRGDVSGGIARIKSGLETLQRQDAALRLPYYLALLTESQLLAGQEGAARAALDGAQAVAHQNSDLWYLPELHRLRGLVDSAHAEAHFRCALTLAREQGARSLELRATTSLAALLQANDRAHEASALLLPVHEAFPTGLVTSDLSRARALLQTLP